MLINLMLHRNEKQLKLTITSRTTEVSHLFSDLVRYIFLWFRFHKKMCYHTVI